MTIVRSLQPLHMTKYFIIVRAIGTLTHILFDTGIHPHRYVAFLAGKTGEVRPHLSIAFLAV